MVVFTQGEVDEFIRNAVDKLFASMPFGNDFQTQRSKDLYVEGGMKILNLLAETSGSDIRVCRKWKWEVTIDYTINGANVENETKKFYIDSPYKTDAYEEIKEIASTDYGYTNIKIKNMKKGEAVGIIKAPEGNLDDEEMHRIAAYKILYGRRGGHI